MISFNAFMLVYDKRTTPSHRQRNLSSEIGLFFASHWFNRLSSTMVSLQEILAQSDLERNGAQDCGHKARLSWRIFHFLDAKYLSRLLVNQPTIWDQTFRTPIDAGLLVFKFRAWEYKRELAPQAMDQLLVSDGFQPTPVDHGCGSKGSQKTPKSRNASPKHVEHPGNNISARDWEGFTPMLAPLPQPTKTDCNAPSKHVSPRATNHGSASDKEGLQPTQRGHGAASGQEDGNTHGDGNGSQPTPEDYGPPEAALTRWLDVEHKLKNMNKRSFEKLKWTRE